MNIRGTFIVEGMVQGVSYRESVKKIAYDHGIVGYVRNRKDETVKVVAEGEEEIIRQFPAKLKIRQGRIQVKDVRERYSDPRGKFTRFRILQGPNISDGDRELLEKMDEGYAVMREMNARLDLTNQSIGSVDSNVKSVDSNIKSMDSNIKSMDSNIGGHFERLDKKYDAFGSSLAQVAQDIHEIKGDLRTTVEELKRAKSA
jgi:acylphosphatase